LDPDYRLLARDLVTVLAMTLWWWSPVMSESLGEMARVQMAL